MIAPLSILKATRALGKEIQAHSKKLRKAGVRALNKTAAKGRTTASKVIRETLNIKASTVKKQLTIKRATPSQMRSVIKGTYQPLPLIQFGSVKKNKNGVTAKVRKDRPRQMFKGAFIAVMPGGHKGVFRRMSRRRLPLRELYGPSVHAVFGDKIVVIVNKTAPDLEKILAREIDYELSK